MVKRLRVGVVGAGIISEIYLKNMISRFDVLDVRAICSARMASARRQAEQFGIRAVTLEEMLSDPEIDMIVNLTPTPAHEDIIRRALMAGKHVYTEKTLTGDTSSAAALSRLAADRGLRLGSAPDTFLGAALQTARKAIDDGLLGEIQSFAIAANRDNRLLTPFYRFLNLPRGGAGYDYAVYHLTALVSLLGPVRQAAAMVRAPYPTHIDLNPDYDTYGKPIPTPNESQLMAILHLESGAAGTIHFNHDSAMDDQAFFAIYGTGGILFLPDPNAFGGEVRFLPAGRSFEDHPKARVLPCPFGYADNSRGLGPADMASAILESRPHRAGAEMACHVLNVVDAIMESSARRAFVDVSSTCRRPEPMPPCTH